MDSIGETRWLILTPGWTSIVQARGSCFSANRTEKIGAHFRASGTHFLKRDPHTFAAQVDAVELIGVSEEGSVAALANVGDDARGNAFGFAIALKAGA
jgi:hypothetical protein